MIREGGHGGSGAVARGFQRGDNSRRAWQASSACLANSRKSAVVPRELSGDSGKRWRRCATG
jgi:hypothetical protein